MEIIKGNHRQIITAKADGYLITDIKDDMPAGEVFITHQLVTSLAVQSSRSIRNLIKELFT